MPEETMSAPQIWERAVSMVKDRIVHMSLWQTLENSVGLILEDDTFVVGLPPRIINQASLLATSDHRNTIEKALASVIGRSVRLRVIEGDCLADWENLKQREARVQAMRDAAYARNQQRIATSQSWDEILEGAARAWSACDMRALPQTKARYVRTMVGIIQEAINRLCPNGVDEVSERLIAKVIDRVATNAEVPATVVALELERTQRLPE